MIAILIINFRRALDTIECLDSLLQVHDPLFHIFLADNGSGGDAAALLSAYVDQYRERITLTLFAENYGFTGAHNRLFEQIVSDERRYKFVLLLNNDTVVEPHFLARMLERIDRAQHIEMVAARMMRYDDRTRIDNLGITFYKCGLASNRKSTNDPLLGPCGGCALYTTDLLRRVHQATDEYFDEKFFCYAEDTDLAWRAALLGYRAAFADDALVYHKGSLASGGPDNDFVLYHGVRNSLFVLIKCVPAYLIWPNLGWILLAHVAILLRHALRGKIRIIGRLYRDFFRGAPAMWRKRRHLQECNPVRDFKIGLLVNHAFYERAYIRQALLEIRGFFIPSLNRRDT
ncbi:MAG: glycosyltransferase family 2 protein [Candidatus Contendobacter sp.]|nr:glycosyltransferase family 2 protein [Candidatus Contendobacter sp.]MDG4557572.1 glycosyltransferase family 2 protein [Candidatus Contendobacter sp.]